MSRRRYVMLVLSVFTICMALLVPMFGKPGSPVTPANDGIPWASKPEEVDGSDDANKTILSIAVSMDADEYEYWKKQNQLFERSHPQISISMTNIRDKDADEARKQAVEADEPYDMMLLDNDRVREFAVQGFLLPADEVVTGDAAADQLEALTSIVKWNGSLWGVPLDSDPLLVVWQKGLLKSAGLTLPPINLQALRSMVEQLATSVPEGVSPFNLNTADAKQMIAWLGMFRENGVPAGDLSSFNLSEKQQLQYAADQGRMVYRLDPVQQKAQLMEAFQTGKLLSAVIPWSVYQSLTNDQRNLLMVSTQNGPLVRTNGRSFVLMAETEKLTEAREYINEMTMTSEQLDRYKRMNRLPSRISAMTREYEYSLITDRPPHFLVNLLGQSVQATSDPAWNERWERFSQLCAQLGGNSHSFSKAAASKFIAQWNMEPEEESDAEAPLQKSLETNT
ncbi:extracellular solute-binding protein [Paenibacillus albus]|uniref:extracellular solute-binding protein n=1 Tax=Paenibacillus albus TaxID=2495582 RepID=UPI0013DEDE55|nr:extracellular solute-binding protein [Paenibacillus albus]